MASPTSPDYIASLLARYRTRLVNLGQRNRSLRLLRLSARWDADVHDLAHSLGIAPDALVQEVVQGRVVRLIRHSALRDGQVGLWERRLTQLYRQLTFLYEETGAYELALGFPFVEGRLLDGSVVRAPLLLLPVRLQRGAAGVRYSLAARTGDEFMLNTTFFRAYEKYNNLRLADTFWDEEPDNTNLQTLLNSLYEILKRHEIAIQFNSELFLRKLRPFTDVGQAHLDTLTVGELKLQPLAVLGIFQQSDTALLQDYKQLEATPAAYDWARLLQPVNKPVTETHLGHYPLPVDASQLAALHQLRAGNHLALDGPPGTGKSQVIVNAIAHALSQGQRVLVVSQKRAALDVVHKRLRALGLAPFSYLIHDYQNDRNAVYGQLAYALVQSALPAATAATTPTPLWELLHQHNQQFNTWQQALQQMLPCGLTPQQLYERITAEDLPELGFNFAQLTCAELETLLQALPRLVLYAEYLQPTQPWYHRLPQHTAQPAHAFLDALPGVLQDWQQRTRQHDYGKVCLLWDVGVVQWAAQHSKVLEQLRKQVALLEHMQSMLVADTNVRIQLHSIEEAWRQLSVLSPQLLIDWAMVDAVADACATYLASPSYMGWWRRSWRQARTLLRKVMVTQQNFGRGAVQDLQQRVQTQLHWRSAVQALPTEGVWIGHPAVTDVRVWGDYLQQQHTAYDNAQQLNANWPAACRLPDTVDALRALVHAVHNITTTQQAWQQQQADWAQWLHPRQIEVLTQAVLNREALTFVHTWQAYYTQHHTALAQVDGLLALHSQAVQQLALAWLPQVAPDDLPKAANQLLQSAYRYWLKQAEQALPVLAYDTARTFTYDLQEWQQCYAQWQAAAAKDVQDQCAHAVQALVQTAGAELKAVQYQVNKRRKLWPLRKLVAQYWQSCLDKLMPVVLASPETVAAIFPMQGQLFDLVIVDEASQCKVEAGLPVLLRGRQCMVVGDEQQLPPFDLFEASVSEEAEAEHVAEEADSLLTFARHHFTHLGLHYHYRSQQQALIAFSNTHFYHNKLHALPVAKKQNLPALHYHPVMGKWENRQNVEEAQAVVQAVCQLVQEQPQWSIGIVTFNYQQRELIQDMLEEQLQNAAPPLAAALQAAMQREEEGEYMGLFIRNIENVQGDERDVILFSLGYAPDANGQLRASFGSLNLLGGERRLNVAITRARQQVQVFVSFDAALLGRVQFAHAGPRLLQAYLQYVAQDPSNTLLADAHAATSEYAQRVAAQLQAAGIGLQPSGCNLFAWRLAGSAVAIVLLDSPQLAAQPESLWVHQHHILLGRGWRPCYITPYAWRHQRGQVLAQLHALCNPGLAQDA